MFFNVKYLTISTASVQKRGVLVANPMDFRVERNVYAVVAGIINHVLSLADDGCRCLVTTLEIQKASYSVHHQFLLHRLAHIGIRGCTFGLWAVPWGFVFSTLLCS